jgi:hypothetical protein
MICDTTGEDGTEAIVKGRPLIDGTCVSAFVVLFPIDRSRIRIIQEEDFMVGGDPNRKHTGRVGCVCFLGEMQMHMITISI